MPKFIDRAGQTFGKWSVLSYAGASKWHCRCACGTDRIVRMRDLVAGKSTTCGCTKAKDVGDARRTHGMSTSRAYNIWAHMKGRCYTPTNTRYPLYGGRGIYVCARWMEFANFLSDMGEPPIGASIDRIDNNGPYSPDNCRWATQLQQVHNSRSTKLTDDDISAIRLDDRPLKVIADAYGVTHTYICNVRAGRIRPPNTESKS